MVIPTVVRKSSAPGTEGPENRRNLIIIATVLGSALILATILTGLLLWSRKRQRKWAGYREACLRDPNLTWDDYERRRKLSRSILVWEQEVQRDIILRKTLQSRTSLHHGGTPPRTPPSATTSSGTMRQPKRSRSQSWHPSTVRPESSDYPEMTEEHRDGFVQEWRDIEASLEQTWQILTGKRHPSTEDGRQPLLRQSGDDPLTRPPTALLRQPSLWAHPAFRGLVRSGTKHSSLPATVGGS